jgi:ABC-2 type transport system ATP-binding protein
MPDKFAARSAERHACRARCDREGAETRIATTDAAATIRALADADPGLADLRIADASLEDAIAVLLAPQERIAA